MKLRNKINFSRKISAKFYKKLLKFFSIRIFRFKLNFQITSNKRIIISALRDFYPPPYGGGNQFMLYLLKNLRAKGYRVKINSFDDDIDIFIADYCFFKKNFYQQILAHKYKFNSKLIHRIDGLLSKYRDDGKAFDNSAKAINKLANTSVIQSKYTLKQFEKEGYRFKNKVIINNSVDRTIFNNLNTDKNNKIKSIVSSSWSTNKQKGMDDYKWLDNNLASSFEYNFIGRLDFVPKNINLKPPMDQEGLANEFRKASIFIFCASNESCSNVLLEAIACGLPVICKDSGGSPEIVKEFGLLYQKIEEVPNKVNLILENLEFYKSLYKKMDFTEAYIKYIKIINKLVKK